MNTYFMDPNKDLFIAAKRERQAREGKIEIIERAMRELHPGANVHIMTEYVPAFRHADQTRAEYFCVHCYASYPDRQVVYEFNQPREIDALKRAASYLKGEAANTTKWREITKTEVN